MTQTAVLVVEDERIVGKDIEERLKDLGYRVIGVVSTGKSAIEKVELSGPDLVLMDIRLSGDLDGIEAAEAIRKRFDIPVIYLTAYADPSTLERAKITEPFGYILKPFNEHDLYSTIEMALYKHKADRALRESEERLVTTLQSLGDAVITTDVNERITFMNRVAEEVVGTKLPDSLQKKLSDFCALSGETLVSDPGDPIKKAIMEGQATAFANHSFLVLNDGRKIPVDTSIAPIRDERRGIIGAVLVFRDVTERKQLENQLKRSREMRVLGQVAAGVAHEVRNPLNAILAITEALFQDIGSNPDYLPYLEHIRAQVNRLSELMKDLLELGKPVRPSQLRRESLMNVLLSTVDLWSQTELSRNHPVSLKTPDGFDGLCVLADSARLQQVFLNLLENAAQNSPEGSDVDIIVLEPEDGVIHIRVSDKGGGIPQDYAKKIFEPFFTTRRGGVGLGLSIVKHLVESMGGMATAWNNPESPGCTIEVILPLMNGTVET